jgi:ComF family protein
MGGLMLCPNCEGRGWHLAAVVPACRYEGALRELIQRFKYGRDQSLARPLAILLGRAFADPRVKDRAFDAILPVPLHRLREREREFNQSALLASLVSSWTRIPLGNFLRRELPTPQQAGFDRRRRMENLRGAFALRRPFPADANLLLVDDVSTTGATLDACAAVLKEAGAADVRAVVVARG